MEFINFQSSTLLTISITYIVPFIWWFYLTYVSFLLDGDHLKSSQLDSLIFVTLTLYTRDEWVVEILLHKLFSRRAIFYT